MDTPGRQQPAIGVDRPLGRRALITVGGWLHGTRNSHHAGLRHPLGPQERHALLGPRVQRVLQGQLGPRVQLIPQADTQT
jgi:hypothetical protein